MFQEGNDMECKVSACIPDADAWDLGWWWWQWGWFIGSKNCSQWSCSPLVWAFIPSHKSIPIVLILLYTLFDLGCQVGFLACYLCSEKSVFLPIAKTTTWFFLPFNMPRTCGVRTTYRKYKHDLHCQSWTCTCMAHQLMFRTTSLVGLHMCGPPIGNWMKFRLGKSTPSTSYRFSGMRKPFLCLKGFHIIISLSNALK